MSARIGIVYVKSGASEISDIMQSTANDHSDRFEKFLDGWATEFICKNTRCEVTIVED